MPTVEVTFAALPAHVRTARLIALAVARRTGVAETLLDEVRLAVGEACSRAVGINHAKSAETPVGMRLSDEQGRFTVEVSDVGPLESDVEDADLAALHADAISPAAEAPPPSAPLTDLLPPGFGLAVISGLVEDVNVFEDADGTHVRMSWPTGETEQAAQR
jgi:anti-sigma regulatory factor (Ser/Thr protein kinase)